MPIGARGYDGYQHRRDRIKKRSLDSEETDKDREKHEDGRSEEIFYQGYTARSMLEVAAMTKPSFILALGDNFYDDGVNSTEDSMWYSHFRDVYFRTDEIRGVKWYSAFGNHDLGYGDRGVEAPDPALENKHG